MQTLETGLALAAWMLPIIGIFSGAALIADELERWLP